jgi:hypothetical protein
MQQVSDGKVTGVAVFLKAGSTNATIQKLWQGMPNTPGKEQEVVGVKLIPAASCTPRSRSCRSSRGPRSTMALGTFFLTGLRMLIAWPFHDPNPANAISAASWEKRRHSGGNKGAKDYPSPSFSVRALLRKVLKCQAWVVSIPTAPTIHLPDGWTLNKNTRGQKGED